MVSHSEDNDNDAPVNLMDLVFLGFNSHVFALHRETGELVWKWKSPRGRGSYVALLLDGEKLIASVQGYTYGLDAVSGRQLWDNPLKGTGLGTPSMVSMRGNSGFRRCSRNPCPAGRGGGLVVDLTAGLRSSISRAAIRTISPGL